MPSSYSPLRITALAILQNLCSAFCACGFRHSSNSSDEVVGVAVGGTTLQMLAGSGNRSASMSSFDFPAKVIQVGSSHVQACLQILAESTPQVGSFDSMSYSRDCMIILLVVLVAPCACLGLACCAAAHSRLKLDPIGNGTTTAAQVKEKTTGDVISDSSEPEAFAQ